MDYPQPVNHQVVFESNVWNVFHSLGQGYSCTLIHASSGNTVWMRPPKGSSLADFYAGLREIEELIAKGLIEEMAELQSPGLSLAEKSYQLTSHGTSLSIELKTKQFEEGQRIFLERVKPLKHPQESSSFTDV